MITSINSMQDVNIIKLNGTLDVAKQKIFKDKIGSVLDNQLKDVVLDFSEVSFIDSSCLGVLVSLVKRLREKKGDLKLARLSVELRSVFQITRLDKVFEIHDSAEAAVNSFYR